MNIIMDSREPDRIKQLINKKDKNINVTKDWLEIGDYLLSNGYAIERKDDDIINSIKSHRIFDQMNNLYKFDNPILAFNVDNLWRLFYFANSNYIHKQWVGFINTVLLKYPKLKLMPYSGEAQFVELLVSLENKINDKSGKKCRPKPLMKKATDISMYKENCLSCIKGISIKKSQELLKEFKTINKIANASEEELKKIDKLGKKTIDNIKQTLN